jgi:hypothetical protein
MTDSSTNPSTAVPTCFFVADGDGYVPTPLAEGHGVRHSAVITSAGWGERSSKKSTMSTFSPPG